jgi:protein-S-isoprenylcysteine O-methyltransferase Ste14
MFKNPFLLLVIICTTTHIIRTIYEVLKHKKIIIPNKVSFVLMFTNMLLLWVSWVLLCRFDNHRIDLPVFILILGTVISFLGLIFFLTALFTIKTLESYEGDLITSGIYRKIRHPMYLGFIFWLVGFPVMFGSPFSFIFSLIFICNILFWRHLEEKELVERFPSYLDYKSKSIF